MRWIQHQDSQDRVEGRSLTLYQYKNRDITRLFHWNTGETGNGVLRNPLIFFFNKDSSPSLGLLFYNKVYIFFYKRKSLPSIIPFCRVLFEKGRLTKKILSNGRAADQQSTFSNLIAHTPILSHYLIVTSPSKKNYQRDTELPEHHVSFLWRSFVQQDLRFLKSRYHNHQRKPFILQ
jgi:hypothetical protein